jgi:hypothetical protein
MSDPNPEYVRPLEPAEDNTSRVTIALIVAILVVILACIAACTAIALVLIYNAPW